MGFIENMKEAVKFAQQLGSVEMTQSLISAQQDALDLMGENQGLRDEVARLTEALELQGTVKYDDGAYWRENGDRDGPFCTKCWNDRSRTNTRTNNPFGQVDHRTSGQRQSIGRGVALVRVFRDGAGLMPGAV